jgi:hypothetical protein
MMQRTPPTTRRRMEDAADGARRAFRGDACIAAGLPCTDAMLRCTAIPGGGGGG